LVKVVKLRKENLEVRCVDDSDTLIVATINPSKVDIYVPDTNEAPGFARVQLNSNEIEQAKETLVSKKPFFQLAPNQIRWAQTTVSITIKEEQVLKPHTIDSPSFGLLINQNLKEKYKVVIEDASTIKINSSFEILATSGAFLAYKNMTHQLILEIKDSHENPGVTQQEELIYNFPQEFVSTNEIKLGQPPVEVRFKLILRSTTAEPEGSSS
jgi:hypothetical protein